MRPTLLLCCLHGFVKSGLTVSFAIGTGTETCYVTHKSRFVSPRNHLKDRIAELLWGSDCRIAHSKRERE